jgi:hypothetical protein
VETYETVIVEQQRKTQDRSLIYCIHVLQATMALKFTLEFTLYKDFSIQKTLKKKEYLANSPFCHFNEHTHCQQDYIKKMRFMPPPLTKKLAMATSLYNVLQHSYHFSLGLGNFHVPNQVSTHV